MKINKKISVTVSCYSEALSYIEERLDENHWNYAYYREIAEKAHEERLKALNENRYDDAAAQSQIEENAKEEVATRIAAFKRIYDLLVESLGFKNS